ncbi:nitrogen fixation protein NifQ [Arcobacter sp. FWKO B]|uniref:nitrogen fixation protein NifQ n=1 Tax=Arcobacter sp. FWKO B TaxID=2593672 RepID=UPI0018A56932|nr:nitrogen fixation protein NifQ [Arcobacter sp. FWKO B]QOG11262.1 hydrogenase [Arcobacter sp. FWKO B]
MSANNYSQLSSQIEALLMSFTDSDEAVIFAREIAKKSIMPNHLYEDLGLPSRAEMNRLMNIHFKPLADIKPSDIRWKKFLFDTIGEVAPACKSCYDQTNCFGCEIVSVKF